MDGSFLPIIFFGQKLFCALLNDQLLVVFCNFFNVIIYL